MPPVEKVVAELRHRGIEPDDYDIQPACKDHFRLTVNGDDYSNCTGFRVLQVCAEETGRPGRISSSRNDGRGFRYTAPQALVDAVGAELAGGVPAAPADEINDYDAEEEEEDEEEGGLAPGADLTTRDDLRAFAQELQRQFGQELVNTWVTYLMRYEAAQEDYKRAQSDLQAQQNKGLCTLREMVRPGVNLTSMERTLTREIQQQLQGLAAEERRAAERCRLVQQRMEQDPAARLMVYRGTTGAATTGAANTPAGPSWFHVAGLLAVVAGLLVQVVTPQAYHGLSLMLGLGQQ